MKSAGIESSSSDFVVGLGKVVGIRVIVRTNGCSSAFAKLKQQDKQRKESDHETMYQSIDFLSVNEI